MSQFSISASEKPILKVFCNDYVFSIPNYQRPYAWTTEHAEELIDDLLDFIKNEDQSLDDLPPYFLGSVVLIKGDKAKAEVIDGQQRLTTLTILLSALRTLLPDKYARAITPYLYQEADLMANTDNQYRLRLREKDASFFQKYIQDEKGLEQLETGNMAALSDSQRNIRENALLFLRRLKVISESRRVFLAQATISRCYLVVVTTSSRESAYRIFSVLNDRGLNLSHVDILKADIIGEIPEKEQGQYTEKWENMEEELGRDAFQSLFAYVRMIYRKVKPQDTVLEEFRNYVWPGRQRMTAQSVIDDVLVPCADAFAIIQKQAYTSTHLAEQINWLFKWLNQIDNSDLLPPAILFLSKNRHDPKELTHFFTDLERLAVGLMVTRANVNIRIERYGRLLAAIESNADLYTSDSPLQLSDQEQKDFIEALNGWMYGWGHCRYVLLRLDEALGDGTASYNYPIISIEHVLPQTPASGSEWLKLFPDEEKRQMFANRLGNLVLLARKKNSAAQNYEFRKKVDVYFDREAASSFRLTSQVLKETEWTPEVIERRQQQMINKLKKIWRLN